jgi:large subunit ribosomal protein L22
MATATGNGTRVRAEAKWVRMSARKARIVLEHIRGRTVPEARTVLAFTPRAAAVEIEKVLRSAVANAEANHGVLDGDALVVARAFADEGPTMKRGRPRARGRFNRVFKRTCHITIELVEIEGEAPRRPAKAEVAATEEPPAAEEKPKARKPASRKKKTEQEKEAVA